MRRQMLVVALVLALSVSLRGAPLPFSTVSIGGFAVDLALFVGYLYLARSLFRLPFAINVAVRRLRHAREYYGVGEPGALFDGFYRGFLDHNRFQSGPLALFDRAGLLFFVWHASTPGLGEFLMGLGGPLGVLVMLIVYLYRGNFALLLDDPFESRGFLNAPNLRLPQD